MKIQRLSASTFRFTSPQGKIIVVDPWLVNDPCWPLAERGPEKLAKTDIVAITHGHFDHLPGLFEIVKANPEVIVVGLFEMSFYLASQGIKNVRFMGVGGTLTVDGIKFTTVPSAHSSGVTNMETGETRFVGPAVGYVIQFEDGFKVYISGDTGLSSEMKLVGDYHKPDVAIVPVSGCGFVMGPKEAEYAVTQMIKPRIVIPFHDFPEVKDCAVPEIMQGMIDDMPQNAEGVGAGKRFEAIMKEHPEFKVRYLAVGESADIS